MRAEERVRTRLLATRSDTLERARGLAHTDTSDEFGISINSSPHPVQAALASAVMFAIGAAMPLIVVLAAPAKLLVPIVFGTTLVFLAALGTLAAFTGGAPLMRAALRVTFWGALAMGLTAAVGAIFGKVV